MPAEKDRLNNTDKEDESVRHKSLNIIMDHSLIRHQTISCFKRGAHDAPKVGCRSGEGRVRVKRDVVENLHFT